MQYYFESAHSQIEFTTIIGAEAGVLINTYFINTRINIEKSNID